MGKRNVQCPYIDFSGIMDSKVKADVKGLSTDLILRNIVVYVFQGCLIINM